MVQYRVLLQTSLHLSITIPWSRYMHHPILQMKLGLRVSDLLTARIWKVLETGFKALFPDCNFPDFFSTHYSLIVFVMSGNCIIILQLLLRVYWIRLCNVVPTCLFNLILYYFLPCRIYSNQTGTLVPYFPTLCTWAVFSSLLSDYRIPTQLKNHLLQETFRLLQSVSLNLHFFYLLMCVSYLPTRLRAGIL